MSKKNDNHFVSIGMAQNFRVHGLNLWKLNCQTGAITQRNTSPHNLFMGKRLWSREVEDAFMKMENEIFPLIKQVINAPYADVPLNCRAQVSDLSKNYLPIFRYIMQSFMLQRANTPESKGRDKKVFSEMFFLDITPPADTVFLIRYNSKHFEKTPLLLVDNCFSVVITPPTSGEQSEYSTVYLLPIAPYKCLAWGTEEQVDYLMHILPTPDAINKNRIIEQGKKCEVASHSLEYLEQLKNQLPYLEYGLGQIQVIAEREYTLSEEKKDGQTENAHAE